MKYKYVASEEFEKLNTAGQEDVQIYNVHNEFSSSLVQ